MKDKNKKNEENWGINKDQWKKRKKIKLDQQKNNKIMRIDRKQRTDIRT